MHRQAFRALDNQPPGDRAALPVKLVDYPLTDDEQRTPSPAKQLGRGITQDSVTRNAKAVLDALNSAESPAALPNTDEPDEYLESPASLSLSFLASPGFLGQDGDAFYFGDQSATDNAQTVATNNVQLVPNQPQDMSRQTSSNAETSGQRLAQVLKDQLVQQDIERQTLETEANMLRQALSNKDMEVARLREENEALAAKLRVAEVAKTEAARAISNVLEQNTAMKQQVLQSQEAAHHYEEAFMNERASTERLQLLVVDLQEQIVALHHNTAQQGTPFYSTMPDTANNSGSEEEGDGGDFPPQQQQQQPEADVFDRVEEEDKDEADSDGTVSEAAAVVRNNGGLKERTQPESDDGDWFDRHHTTMDAHNTPTAGVTAASDAEEAKKNAAEIRLLRSELMTMERKGDQLSEALLKANHTIRVLQQSLQTERETITGLHEEKTKLMAQLLDAQQALQDRSQIDPGQMEALLEELALTQRRAEALLQENGALAEKLEAAKAEVNEKTASKESAVKQATEATENERKRAEALELEIRHLSTQLGELRSAGQRLEAVSASLQQAEARASHLEAQLEIERSCIAGKSSQVAMLTDTATAATEEVMELREALQAERATNSRLSQDNAALVGRLEALDSTLGRLERSEGDVVANLVKDKSELQGQCARAEEAAKLANNALDAARKDLADAADRIAQLEEQLADIKAEMNQREEMAMQLRIAATAAAEQLQILSDNNCAMENELLSKEHALVNSNDEISKLIAARDELTSALEWTKHRVNELENMMHDANNRHDGLVAELEDTIIALEGSENDRSAVERALQATVDEKQNIAAHLDDALARLERQRESMDALKSECEALRSLGSNVEDTNRELVDNMCDMSGLIDAVAALQRRCELLQQELDTSEQKGSVARAARDALLKESAALAAELEHETSKTAQLTTATVELQQALIQSEAAVAAASHRGEDLAHELTAVKAEREALLSRCCNAEAAAAAGALAEVKLADLRAEVASLLSEKEAWLNEARDIRKAMEEAEQARGLAEGRLVLAKQREAAFKEASHQMREFHDEVAAAVAECEELRRGRETAEDRCAELVARCLDLGERKLEAEESLRRTEASLQAKEAECTILSEQVAELKRTVAQLEEQASVAVVLSEKMGSLESERRENTAWMHDAVSELTSKSEELMQTKVTLESVQAEAEIQRDRADRAEESLEDAVIELEIVKKARMNAEDKAKDLEVRLGAAIATSMQLKEQLQQATEQGMEAAGIKDLYEAAKSEAATAQADLERANAQVASLSERISSTESSLMDARATATAGLLTAKQLGDKLEQSVEAQSMALEATETLRTALSTAEARSEDLSRRLEDRVSALAALQSERDALHAEAASSSRAAELLERQCGVLREQLEFLQTQRTEEEGADDRAQQALLDMLRSSQQEHSQLRERLTSAASELAVAEDATLALQRQLTAVEEALEEQEYATEAARKDAQVAEAAVVALRNQLTEQQHQVTDLERELTLAETLKDQFQSELQVAREDAATASADLQKAREQAVSARQQLAMLESDCAVVVQQVAERLQQQVACLQSMEETAKAAVGAEQFEGLVEDLEAMKEEHIRVWGPLQSAASALQNATTNATTTNHIQQHEDLLERLQAAQAAALHVAGMKRAEAQAQETEQARREHTAAQEAAWTEEKRAMKAVCKLALAVTMDRVALGNAAYNSTNQEVVLTAADVATELKPCVEESRDAMNRLGLDRVWTSLCQLVSAGSKARDHLGECRRLESERNALDARCASLELSVREIEAVAGRWQQRATAADRAAFEVAGQLDALAASVRWASGDFTGSSTAKEQMLNAVRDSNTTARDDSLAGSGVDTLEASARQVSLSINRLLRKHKTLTRHLNITDVDDLDAGIGAAGYAFLAGSRKGVDMLAMEAGRKADAISARLQHFDDDGPFTKKHTAVSAPPLPEDDHDFTFDGGHLQRQRSQGAESIGAAEPIASSSLSGGQYESDEDEYDGGINSSSMMMRPVQRFAEQRRAMRAQVDDIPLRVRYGNTTRVV